MKEYKNYSFPWQHSPAKLAQSLIVGAHTCWESNEFEKIRNIFSAVMYTLINMLMFWPITKFDMVYFHYYNIHTARSSFSFHTTRRHSNKAVQQSVQLIATHINDKT